MVVEKGGVYGEGAGVQMLQGEGGDFQILYA